MKKKSAREFYGTATVGAKGQVVIPCDARDVLKLKEGDKLLVFGVDKDIIAFAKPAELQKLTDKISRKIRL
jgi:AbrB family looped-hinge helix DNA binding protein